MDTALSQNEREALSRFLGKIIEDVDKLAILFESRGADSTLTRAAQENLKVTLAGLQGPSQAELPALRAYVPSHF